MFAVMAVHCVDIEESTVKSKPTRPASISIILTMPTKYRVCGEQRRRQHFISEKVDICSRRQIGKETDAYGHSPGIRGKFKADGSDSARTTAIEMELYAPNAAHQSNISPLEQWRRPSVPPRWIWLPGGTVAWNR
jgi:hypothetical protein